MLHPRSLPPALVAVLTVVTAVLGAAVLPAAPAAAAPQTGLQTGSRTSLPTAVQATRPVAEGDAPLVVTVGSLSPSTVPVRGPVRVTGTVTNRDDVTWSRINLYPFVSAAPMTTRAELVEAAATDPAAEVGERKLDDGEAYFSIDELEPGQTAAYEIQIPRSELGVSDQGVYWFGVHALGESAEEGRTDGADGRARTFLPYLRSGAAQAVDLALVLPLRAPVRYATDGSLTGLDEWTASLAGGSLDSLVSFGAAAGPRPVTWLVDPAVLDAATRLAAGNPGRSLAPTIEQEVAEDPDAPDPDETGEPSSSASASPSEPPTPSDDPSSSPDAEEPEEVDPEAAPAAEAATAWLEQLRSALGEARDGTAQLLTLPYGDLDVPASAEHDPEAYLRARQRSGATLRLAEVAADPAVSPPSGVLDRAALDLVAADETVLVTDEQVLGDRVPAAGAPAVTSVEGHRLVLASSAAATGGPGPDPRLATVALRQRVLAEAAVRRLSPGREPLVVVVPVSGVPRSGTAFFAGLDVDWLRLTTVDDVVDGPAATLPADALAYPARQARRELDALDFASADRLTRAGAALQNLLVRNDQVGREVADQALTSLSYTARDDPATVRAANDGSRAWIESRLRGVTIEAPNQVTLSSASGQFSATVSNTLDEPVTVAIRAFVDDDMVISSPESTVQLAPRSRRTVLLTAATERQGIHNVTLVLTDVRGTPLGSSDELPIRAAQVSGVIWLIIGTGCALLFGAIAVRLVRRVRAARRDRLADPAASRTSEPGQPVAQT